MEICVVYCVANRKANSRVTYDMNRKSMHKTQNNHRKGIVWFAVELCVCEFRAHLM